MTIEAKRTVKRNDTGPPVRVQVCNESNGSPQDFGAVASVSFHMTSIDGTLKVDSAAAVEAPAEDGILRYDWAVGDTDTAGKYDAEFEVTFASGAKETYPADGFIEITIIEDLDNG